MYGAKIVEKSGTRQLLEKQLHPYTNALFEATSIQIIRTWKHLRKYQLVNRQVY